MNGNYISKGEHLVNDLLVIHHHGILGMKWGIRRYQNKDGSLTKEGKERYQKGIVKSIKKNYTDADDYGYSKTTKAIASELKKVANDKDIQEAKNAVAKANEMYRKFSENEKLREEYAAYAGIITGKKYTPDDPYSIKSYVWLHKYDDMDQGTGNSFSLYCLDKGTDAGSYGKKVMDAYDKYSAVRNKKIEELLGSHSDDVVNITAYGKGTKAKNVLRDAVDEIVDVPSYFDGHMNKADIPAYKKALADAKKEYDKYNVPFDWSESEDNMELSHHGILGQKWGVRRYQNADGTLTAAGKKRYGAENVYDIDNKKGLQRRLNDLDKAMAKNARDNADAVRKLITKKNYATKALKKKVATEENITRGRAEVDALLEKNGSKFNISTKSTYRNVTKGRDIVKSLGYTALLNALTIPISRVVGGSAGLHGGATTVGLVGMGKVAKGTKYKVKDKDTRETVHYIDLTKVSEEDLEKFIKDNK